MEIAKGANSFFLLLTHTHYAY